MDRKLVFLAFVAVTGVANAQNYRQRVSASNPLAYWTFETNNGASTVGGFTLTQTGGTTVSAAGSGAPIDVASNRSLDFDGTGNAQTSLSTEFQGGDHGTMMFWLNFHSDPQGNTFNAVVYSKSGCYSVLNRMGAPFTANITSAMSFADNQVGPAFGQNTWNHIAFVYDRTAADPNGKRQIYLNGQLATADGSPNGFDPSGFLQLGGSFGFTTSNLNGSLDEFAVWNRSLSATEIASIYSPVPEPFTFLALGIGAAGLVAKRKRRS